MHDTNQSIAFDDVKGLMAKDVKPIIEEANQNDSRLSENNKVN